MSLLPAITSAHGTGTPDKRMFYGVYLASVVNTNDLNRANRVTLKVPQVLGTATSNWADPVNPYQVAPAVNTTVYAMFIGGDINHPVYMTGVTTATTPWAQLTPLGTGWSAGGGIAGVFYRMMSTGDVILAWDITTTTVSNANVIATLPTGFRPATTVQAGSGWIGGPTGYSSAFEPSLSIATSGAITAQGIPFTGTLEMFGTEIIPMGVL